MKGIESVVGAYLAVVIVIGSMFAFYTWVSSYTRSINEQVAGVLERTHQVIYPPVLSIKHANASAVVLEVHSYTPTKAKEIVVKSLNDRLLYHELLNARSTLLELVIPKPNETAIIYLVTDEGLVFYYVPRLDPRLQLAPEYIRAKLYVDDELLDYISNQYTRKTWALLSSLGYKVSWGRTSPGLVNTTLLRGPVICALSSRIPCNVNASLDSAILTHGLNGTSVFRHVDGFLEIVEYFNNYTQIYRVIRFTGTDNITLRVNLSLRVTRSASGLSYAAHFIPVVYLYDPYYDSLSHVSIYHAQVYPSNIYPLPTIRPWLARIPLSDVVYWNSTSYYTGFFEVYLRPVDYGVSEGYILVGIEAVVLVTSYESYVLRVRVDVS